MATLDKKLKEIAEESAREAPTGQEEAERSTGEAVPSSLDEQACAIMGEQLLNYFVGRLPGQRPSYGKSVHQAFVPLINEVGLYLFTMTSAHEQSYGELIRTSFTRALPEDIMARIVRTACGEYAGKTDLMEAAVKGGMEHIVSLLPEMGRMQSSLLSHSSDVLSSLATVNPYLIVMGMAHEHRALAALAVEKAIQNGHITFSVTDPNQWQYRLIKNAALDACLPFASDFTEVAEEHGLTEVIPAMEDYRRVWQTHRSDS